VAACDMDDQIQLMISSLAPPEEEIVRNADVSKA